MSDKSKRDLEIHKPLGDGKQASVPVPRQAQPKPAPPPPPKVK